MEVRALEPRGIWNHFEDLNAVPRPSKKEERVIKFIKEFGEKLNLETYVDPVGNVIIKKPASPGMEGRKRVVLQAHLDMVHQKNSDTNFDFDTEGIRSFIEGEWVTSEGTTLGADNGMGVAAAMTVLASTDMDHPAIEALFTIDEETGMTGAFGLEGGLLNGDILLNLDTEDDDELSIGCAGGIDTNVEMAYQEEVISGGIKGYKLTVKGLKGGHSGMDIHLGRANANKVMNRLMFNMNELCGLRISEIDGGSLRNAIPRESFAVVGVEDSGKFENEFAQRVKEIKSEFKVTEPQMEILLESCSSPEKGMNPQTQKSLIQAIYATPNGVYRMSADIPGLVETSSSLARIIVKNGNFMAQGLQRSSVDSSKMDIAHSFGAAFELIGANVEHTGSYPGWSPNMDSAILNTMKDLYIDLFKEEPKVKACHAGLECGILGVNYPGMDMISFGPTIRNPHSPDEKVNIKSVQKFWVYLTETLKSIPVKN